MADVDHHDYDDIFDECNISSELQRRFVAAYFEVNFNGTEAVRRAGYNTKWPNRIAFQLLEKDKIKEAIKLVSRRREESIGINTEYVLRKMKKALESAEEAGKHGEMIRATEVLMKYLQLFVERTEITGKDGGAIKHEEIKNEATEFARSITRLAERGRKGEAAFGVIAGGKSVS